MGSPVLGRWGRSGHSETGARFVRGRSEGSSRPLFNRPRVRYTPAVVVWRRWEDGGEVGEQGEDLGALCRSTQQVQILVSDWRKQASKQVQRGSEERLAWKTEARKKPETEAVQIRPRPAAPGAATTIIKR